MQSQSRHIYGNDPHLRPHASIPPPSLTPTQPFIDADVGLHTFFPPRYYAIAIPAILLVLFVGLVGLFIGLTMLKATVEKQGKIQEDVARSSRQAVASSRGRRKSKKT